MITYEWYFSDLMVKPSENGLTDVLYIVHWQFKGTDKNGVFGDQRGSCQLPAPDPAKFYPYSSLTKETVEKWVEKSIGYTAISAFEKAIAEQIKFQTNPPFIRKDAPWTL